MKNVLVALALLSVAGILTGCNGGETDYEQKVELTPEQEAQRDKNMAGQQAPGQITPGQPVDTGDSGGPSEGVQLPPGKGG